MLALYIILSLLIGYLLCSINVSVLISRLAYKSDVRDHGSGNAGATNMARVYGLKGGLLVLLGDFVKAILACVIIRLICGPKYEELCFMLTGIACVIGHAYPVFFNFKGGKGVTVGAAIALMIDWKAFLFIVLVFVLTFIFTKTVSKSSMLGALGLIVITLCCYVLSICGVGNGYFDNFTIQRVFLAMVASLMAIWLHRENILRILKGEEKQFTFHKKQANA